MQAWLKIMAVYVQHAFGAAAALLLVQAVFCAKKARKNIFRNSSQRRAPKQNTCVSPIHFAILHLLKAGCAGRTDIAVHSVQRFEQG